MPPALEVWSLNHWTAREVPHKVDILKVEASRVLPVSHDQTELAVTTPGSGEIKMNKRRAHEEGPGAWW